MQELDEMFYPCVLQVVPTDNYEVYAYFNDGSIRCIDMKPLLNTGPVFKPLSDIKFFKEKVAVINDTVAWDISGNRNACKCIDIDPGTIFKSPIIKEAEVLKHIQQVETQP